MRRLTWSPWIPAWAGCFLAPLPEWFLASLFEPWWVRQPDEVRVFLSWLSVCGLLLATLYELAPGLLWRVCSIPLSKHLLFLEPLSGLLETHLVPMLARRRQVREAWVRQFLREGQQRDALEALAPELVLAYARTDEGRRAWIQQLQRQALSVDDMSEALQALLFKHEDVLDAWVGLAASRVDECFRRRRRVEKRLRYVPHPVGVSTPGRRERILEEPGAVSFRPYLASRGLAFVITGQAGIGKSGLAFKIAEWGLAEQPARRLTPHVMLPALVDHDFRDAASFEEGIRQGLRSVMEPELWGELVRTPALFTALLAAGRILVIVDALSERRASTQEALRKLADGQKVRALLVTSREPLNLARPDVVMLRPTGIDSSRLQDFVWKLLPFRGASCLRYRNDWKVLVEKLEERSRRPREVCLTPLVVRLFVDAALKLHEQERALEELPNSISEIVAGYFKALYSRGSGPKSRSSVSYEETRKAARCLAYLSLGKRFEPGRFSKVDAEEMLEKCLGARTSPGEVIDRLVAMDVLRQSDPAGDFLEFELTLVAEYLAAMWLVINLGADKGRWMELKRELQAVPGHPQAVKGFRDALNECVRKYRGDCHLPEGLEF